MRALRYCLYIIFILFCGLALFFISFGIFCADEMSGQIFLLCVLVFIVCAAGMLLVFILDRQKPLIFAALYIAADFLGAGIPIAVQLFL